MGSAFDRHSRPARRKRRPVPSAETPPSFQHGATLRLLLLLVKPTRHGHGSTRRKFIHGVRSSTFRVPVRGAASQNGGSRLNRYFFLGGTTASLNALAKRNLTTVFAGMLIGSPV